MSINILVVIYGKEINQSLTMKSLCQINSPFNLVVYNNGPNLINPENNFFLLFHENSKIKIIQDLKNSPLSMVYNDFMAGGFFDIADFNVILDDDSDLPINYFENLNEEIEVYLPIIKNEKGKVFYPSINSKSVSSQVEINEDDVVFSIGSGLIISKSLIEVFDNHHTKLFNESFSLYGVDFSFFRNISYLKNIGCQINISIKSCLIHDLSYDGREMSFFRDKERKLDFILSHKIYSEDKKIHKYIWLLKFIVRSCIFSKVNRINNIKSIPLYCWVFYTGKHPNCK
ncbi:hypothetical protein HGT70_07960 [Rosenbergiella collisarenosi]|uniref:hypothetical protein n=1 Tax=Rosenbergiella collisarenosi TaxID=1544695 RepID=UPI001BDAE14C|nr:hypothetical protein [Rosenbergiella collisarenosi]MBT0721219.1 hypothetical protein [Rosenbergiella collisarenosi]